MNMLKHSTPNEVLLAMLVAELGESRTSKLMIDQVARHPDMPEALGEELMSSITHAYELTGSLLPLEQFSPEQLEEGGNGKAVFEAALKGGIELAEEPETLSEHELLNYVLLFTLTVKSARNINEFLATHVSERAADAVAEILNEFRSRMREADIALNEEAAFGRYLSANIDEELRGPRRTTVPTSASRIASIVSALLGLGGAVQQPTVERGPLGEIFGRLRELRGMGARQPDIQMEVVSIADLLRGRQPTLGDVWAAKNVPFGLPDTMAKALLRAGEWANEVNMDEMRKTPLHLLANDEDLESFANATYGAAREGMPPQMANLLFMLVKLAKENVEELYGSVEQAIAELGGMPAEDARYYSPNGDCTCVRCSFIRSLAESGIRIDRVTGQQVRQEDIKAEAPVPQEPKQEEPQSSDVG